MGETDNSTDHAIPEELLPAAAKGLIFDLDGTLIDAMKHHWEAWRKVTSEHGLKFSVARLLSLAGKPSTEIFAILCQEQGREVDIRAAVDRKAALYCELAEATTTIESVMRIAHAAKARGLPMAVATGGSRPQVSTSMRAAGLEGFFDAVVTCEDVAHGKPHPETFLRAAELIGVPPELCVGYEDAPLGLEAIERAGFLLGVDVTKLPGYPHLTE